MLLRDVEVGGRRVDVRVDRGVIAALGDRLPGPADVDGRGGALLPGLHDHHIHLLATAAASGSVDAGPPAVRTRGDLVTALRAARPIGGWVRAVNYHEGVAGVLDRTGLDAARADVPVRMQHRSGALWVLNSAAVRSLGMDEAADLPAVVERDALGRVTGRVWRGDAWLGERLRRFGAHGAPDLAAVGARLAACGVTGVTDATPVLDPAAAGLLAAALASGALPQRLTLLAADQVMGEERAWQLGPAKIVVADHDLPGLDDVVEQVRVARAAGRAVAVHCVTVEALALTIAALVEVGTVAGDRVEHAAVAPPHAVAVLAELGVRVVTQPSLPALRGDDYLDGVAGEDRRYLWPFRSLLDAGIGVGCSSDAPYGDCDPWAGVRAAVERRTPSGRGIGVGERVDARTALAAYLTPWADPGGAVRVVAVGAPADLVLLDVPLAEALAEPDSRHVRATLVGGRVVHGGL